MAAYEIDYSERLVIGGYPPTEEGLKCAAEEHLEFWRDYYGHDIRHTITDASFADGVWSFTLNQLL